MNRDDFARKYGWDGKEKTCEGALHFIDSFPPDATADDIWEELGRADWALWLLKRLVDENDKRFRMMACGFVWLTPVIGERKVWDVLPRTNAREVLEASQRHANGSISDDELNDVLLKRPSPAERLAERAARATAIFPAVYSAMASAEKCRLCAGAVAREEDQDVVRLKQEYDKSMFALANAADHLAHEWGKNGHDKAEKEANDSHISSLGILSNLERARMVAARKANEVASEAQCRIIREYFPSVEGL